VIGGSAAVTQGQREYSAIHGRRIVSRFAMELVERIELLPRVPFEAEVRRGTIGIVRRPLRSCASGRVSSSADAPPRRTTTAWTRARRLIALRNRAAMSGLNASPRELQTAGTRPPGRAAARAYALLVDVPTLRTFERTKLQGSRGVVQWRLQPAAPPLSGPPQWGRMCR